MIAFMPQIMARHSTSSDVLQRVDACLSAVAQSIVDSRHEGDKAAALLHCAGLFIDPVGLADSVLAENARFGEAVGCLSPSLN